ncbi:MAG: MBL fold metallo-hydrolase [Myxococcaceae bacterium]|nr:MBL fold metallo-hydrolase [Myxococcaceae bacterium]
MAFTLGRFVVHPVHDGTFSLDGGAMFGVVPKPLWERSHPADARNRIRLALRCMLLEDGQRRILVDDGIGTQWDGKHQDMFGIDHTESTIDAALAHAGCSREAITDVVLTHLHFDHAGGTTRQEGGERKLSFPNATYHLQRRHWKWAHQPTEKDRGSFRPEDFEPLEKSGRLHLIEGATELYPELHLFISEGHTVGLQLVRLESAEQALIYCGDLVPTTAHLKPSWVAAYDLYPLTVIEEKKMLLAQAVEDRSILFFEHDLSVAACTVKDSGAGQVVVDRLISL